MDEAALAARQFLAQLADGFEERQAFDIADRAADLDQDEIGVAGIGQDELLDLVGDVRHHLNGRTQVVAATLLFDDVGVDASGRDVVGLGGVDTGEAFIVAEIEIGFGAVVSNEDLAVLVRAHRARIDVKIRVELAQADLEAARLKQRAEGRRGEPLAKRRDHPTSDEDVTRHRNHSIKIGWLRANRTGPHLNNRRLTGAEPMSRQTRLTK